MIPSLVKSWKVRPQKPLFLNQSKSLLKAVSPIRLITEMSTSQQKDQEVSSLFARVVDESDVLQNPACLSTRNGAPMTKWRLRKATAGGK